MFILQEAKINAGGLVMGWRIFTSQTQSSTDCALHWVKFGARRLHESLCGAL